MSQITLNHMHLDEATRRATYYGASRLTKLYLSMPNIKAMTPETEIQAPSAVTVQTESRILTENNVAMVPVVCVVSRVTDASIMDSVVTANTVKPRRRSFWSGSKNSSGVCCVARSAKQFIYLLHSRRDQFYFD